MAKKTGGLGADAIFARAPRPLPKEERIETPSYLDDSRSSNVTLPTRVWEWIDAKHSEQRSNGGAPLRKAAIIRAVFEVAMALQVDLAGCQTEEEMLERFQEALHLR